MKRIFLALALISIFLFAATLTCMSVSIPFCSALSSNSLIIGTGAIQLGLFSVALFFLWDTDLRTTLKKLGFPGKLSTTAIYSVAGFIAMFALLVIVGIASMAFGFDDQYKIYEKIGDLPWYMLMLAVLLAPICEELFFRGLLVPRFGVVISAIVFGLLHFTYGSILEVVGVMAIGLVLGMVFKKSKSITPCIVVHLLYNLLSISVMLFAGSHA